MQTCWRSDKVEFCEINKRNAGMQRSTISMFAQLVQLMGGKIEFHQGLRMNLCMIVHEELLLISFDCSSKKHIWSHPRGLTPQRLYLRSSSLCHSWTFLSDAILFISSIAGSLFKALKREFIADKFLNTVGCTDLCISSNYVDEKQKQLFAFNLGSWMSQETVK